MNKHRSTFTLDEETEAVLRRTAERLSKTKSEIVREAVQEYGARAGRLSEAERLRLLAVFDEHVPAIPQRSLAEVEAELEEIRQSRQAGGRSAGRTGRRGDTTASESGSGDGGHSEGAG